MAGLEGARELDAKLQELGKSVRGRALRKAVTEAMKPARQAALARVPQGSAMHRTYKGRLVAPGFTSRNVLIASSLDRTKERATARLGVAPEAFYALQFIERGTFKDKPQPWLAPSFESSRGAVETDLTDTLRAQILKAARRKGRSSGGSA